MLGSFVLIKLRIGLKKKKNTRIYFIQLLIKLPLKRVTHLLKGALNVSSCTLTLQKIIIRYLIVIRLSISHLNEVYLQYLKTTLHQ